MAKNFVQEMNRCNVSFASIGDLRHDILLMEKRRFEDALAIELDLADQGFLLPPFTVQTLVENAITHGIRERENGCGKLTVKTYETEDEHIIEVIDDGVGFDVAALEEDDAGRARKHVGLANLKERLGLMADGRLELRSTVGAGTKAMVHIPKAASAGRRHGYGK